MEQVDRKDELSFATVDFDGPSGHPRAILWEEGFPNLNFRKEVDPRKMKLEVISIERVIKATTANEGNSS